MVGAKGKGPLGPLSQHHGTKRLGAPPPPPPFGRLFSGLFLQVITRGFSTELSLSFVRWTVFVSALVVLSDLGTSSRKLEIWRIVRFDGVSGVVGVAGVLGFVSGLLDGLPTTRRGLSLAPPTMDCATPSRLVL